MRRLTCAMATAAVFATLPAPAAGPSWAYLQGQYVWAWPQLNEPGRGWNAQGSMPLGDTLYLMGSGERIHASYDKLNTYENFSIGAAAVGAHFGSGTAQAFMQLSYADKTRTRYEPASTSGDHSAGIGGALGARWLATPWLSIEPQYGIKGYVFDGFTKLDVALRLMPHVWAVGTFDHGLFSGNEYRAGIRWFWEEYSPARLPGARAVGAAPRDSAGEFAAGQTLVTLRPLVPQVRPAAGAPEMAPVPKDSTIALAESTSNEFGTWWRIVSGRETGWIRETDLKGVR